MAEKTATTTASASNGHSNGHSNGLSSGTAKPKLKRENTDDTDFDDYFVRKTAHATTIDEQHH